MPSARAWMPHLKISIHATMQIRFAMRSIRLVDELQAQITHAVKPNCASNLCRRRRNEPQFFEVFHRSASATSYGAYGIVLATRSSL